MTSSNDMDTDRDLKTDEIVRLVRGREVCASAEEYNAITVQIMAGLVSLSYQEPVARATAWMWFMATLLADIEVGTFPHPFKFDQEDGEDVLCIRTKHIMDHLMRGDWLRKGWEDAAIQSALALKKQMKLAGVFVLDADGNPKLIERTLNGQRVGHLVAIRLAGLRAAGLNPNAASQAAYPPTKP